MPPSSSERADAAVNLSLRWDIFCAHLKMIWKSADSELALAAGGRSDPLHVAELIQLVRTAKPAWSKEDCGKFVDESLRWNVFAAHLTMLWSRENDAELALAAKEARGPSNDAVLVKLVRWVRPTWSEEEYRTFVESGLRDFRLLDSDEDVWTEFGRRSHHHLEPEAVQRRLRKIAGEVDDDSTLASGHAVIAGLIGRLYGSEQRIAYVVESVLDLDLEDDSDMEGEDDSDMEDDQLHEELLVPSEEPAGSPSFEGWLKGSPRQRAAVERMVEARERGACARFRVAYLRSLVGKVFLSIGWYVVLGVVGGSGFQIWNNQSGGLTSVQLIFGWVILLGVLWLLATHDRLNSVVNGLMRGWDEEERYWRTIRDDDRQLLQTFRSGAWGGAHPL